MKVQALQENLAKGLTVASRIISGKAQLPILSNVLIKSSSLGFFIVATNLESGVRINVGAKVEEEGEITVPAKLFTEVVSNLQPGKIELLVEEGLLKLSTATYKAAFNGIPASEFPELPVYKEDKLISLPVDDLLEAINQVVFAAAVDDTRPVLTGVLVRIEGKNLSLVATDGYRLSLKTIELGKKIEEKILVILPAKALMEVARMIGELGEGEKELKMGFTEDRNQVVFVFPQKELFTRVIDGDFPDYQKIIPQSYNTRVLIDRESLARELKVVSIFARESSNIVKMKFKEGFLEMSANSPQVGENKSMLEAKIEGEELEIAFNYRFLTNFLGAVSSEEVCLEFSGSLNPGIFKAVGDENFLHIIMPIRLQGES